MAVVVFIHMVFSRGFVGFVVPPTTFRFRPPPPPRAFVGPILFISSYVPIFQWTIVGIVIALSGIEAQ